MFCDDVYFAIFNDQYLIFYDILAIEAPVRTFRGQISHLSRYEEDKRWI